MHYSRLRVYQHLQYTLPNGDKSTNDGSQAANWKTMKRLSFTGKLLFSFFLRPLPAVAFPTRVLTHPCTDPQFGLSQTLLTFTKNTSFRIFNLTIRYALFLPGERGVLPLHHLALFVQDLPL